MTQTTTAAARRARTPLAHPDHHAEGDGAAIEKNTTELANADATGGSDHHVEPWARYMLGSIVPAFAAMYVPHAVKLALFALTGVLFAVALVLLMQQERRRG